MYIGIDGTQYDENSEINRHIKECFVSKEVHANITDIVVMFAESDKYEDFIRRFDNSDGASIYQFLKVSNRLGELLSNRGEAVLQTITGSTWGRQSYGRAAEEPVIADICKDLEILEGQKYSWENVV